MRIETVKYVGNNINSVIIDKPKAKNRLILGKMLVEFGKNVE